MKPPPVWTAAPMRGRWEGQARVGFCRPYPYPSIYTSLTRPSKNPVFMRVPWLFRPFLSTACRPGIWSGVRLSDDGSATSAMRTSGSARLIYSYPLHIHISYFFLKNPVFMRVCGIFEPKMSTACRPLCIYPRRKMCRKLVVMCGKIVMRPKSKTPLSL